LAATFEEIHHNAAEAAAWEGWSSFAAIAKACGICGVGRVTGVLGWQVERSHFLGQDIDLIARQSTRRTVGALMLVVRDEAG